ncbi:MAG: hypothetical protein GF353_22220 [Candidatus Lokiarchaeota archaeon]|nr:hypothetical protein [Candidatus Lokiarchaeota archaeon]
MPPSKTQIVFDANFFICMNSIKARDFLTNLNKAGKDLNYEFFISEIVFNEIKAPISFKDKFKTIINVKKIENKSVDHIKQKLMEHNIRFPAQDPDLSLIVLADELITGENNSEVHLVTDDFKLAKNTNLLYRGKINILSLSGFLLKVQRSATKAQMRNYFKNVWKKSLNYTLSYMIERSKIYPAEQKITWLIEKAISVTEKSIITQDSQLDGDKAVKFEIGATKYSEEIEIAEKYIENQKIPPSEEKKIQSIFNFLENLKISREYVKRARKAIVKNNSKDAVKFLKKGNGFLISLLQVASGQLNSQKDYDIVESLICSEISKMEFLRAFLLVSIGRISTAVDSLERAALFSTIIHNHQTCLTLNYLKALILLFHGLYQNSILAYNFTEELADLHEDERLKLKCGIGKAIALYIQGGEEDKITAMAIMDEISGINFESKIADAIVVFSELGDYFLALGHSQLATNLYNESMEMAIDAGIEWKVNLLIEKLKRAYIATVLNGYTSEDMVDRIDILLDKAYNVKDVDKYNEQIKKIASFNILFYTPFPHLTGKRKAINFSKLPKELQDDYLEVVSIEKIQDKENQYLFIVTHYELGLLGFKIKTDENITGIPENYSIKLKPTAKVKIYEPDEDLKDQFLIRAIIEVTAKNQTEIVYTLPSFFKQLNL